MLKMTNVFFFHYLNIVIIIYDRVFQQRIATFRFVDFVKQINDVIDQNNIVMFFFYLSQKTLNQ